MVILIYDSSYRFDPSLKKPDYYLPHYLAENNKVIYVCLPRNVRSLRPLDIFKSMLLRFSKEENNLYVINWPWWLSTTYFNRKLSQLTSYIRRFIVKAYSKSIRSEGDRIVEYYTHPSTFTFFKIFKESFTVYNPYDLFAKYGVSDDDASEKYEHMFMKKFDVVIVPHIAMKKYLLKIGIESEVVPWGVEYDLYKKALENEKVNKNILDEIKKPIVGFMGIINERIDLDLIAEIATKKKGWSFVFIGPVKFSDSYNEKFNILCQKENVHWIGFIKPDLLPEYLIKLDVGVIPMSGYLKRWVKYSSNPLKLHQYAAAGLPIVTCEIENITNYYTDVFIAKSKTQWISNIEKALEKIDKSKNKISINHKEAQKYDWPRIIYEIENILIKTQAS